MMNMIIDCGTTNLRVTLTDEVGNVLARSSRPGGVRHTAIDGHNGRLKTMLRECTQVHADGHRPLDSEY